MYPKRNRIYADLERCGTLGGKRVRFVRKSFEVAVRDAERIEHEIQQHGQLAGALTTEQRWMAAQAFLICERLGVVLLDIVREFESTHPHGPNARSLDQLRVEVVAAKRKIGRSECHVDSLDYRLRCLVGAIGDKPITAITTEELQAELDRRRGDWNPTTVNSVVQGWKIALNFAIRRGWLVKNPANRLELPQIIHEEPSVLTVEQARRLLAATLFSDRDPLLPECCAYLAIGMFAGLRPMKEMPHLDWSDVDLEAATITVRAKNAKARVRRIIRIEPCLSAWLRPLARRHGPVLRRPVDELRAAARAVLGCPKWPSDILRHTFASYHFELYHDEARTKKALGHRDDGRVFYDHYCRPVYPAACAQFWATVPPVGLLTAGANDDGMRPLRGVGIAR